jgi:SM-20-related protein
VNDDSGALERLVDGIASQGWASCDEFVDAPLARNLHDHATTLHEQGQFKPAAVGAGERRALRLDVRSDEICWLVDCASPPLREACARFEELRLTLNRALALGLFEHEVHYARYGPGAHYQRHIDHSSGDARRIISTALYLNEHWTPQHGGQLRLHLDQEAPRTIDILPEAGRLVIFLSEQFYHEVLPAERERVSLTGWFRRRGTTF